MLWITSDGIYHHFMRAVDSTLPATPPDPLAEPADVQFDQLIIKANLVGANPALTVAGETLLPHKTNYLIGNDPGGLADRRGFLR